VPISKLEKDGKLHSLSSFTIAKIKKTKKG
jgi:hypothetical protein